MLKVTCKGCGANYKAPDDFAGRKIRCKACSEGMLGGEAEAPSAPSPAEAEAPPAPPPAEAEASQEAAPAEKKAPGKKKISFKKGREDKGKREGRAFDRSHRVGSDRVPLIHYSSIPFSQS